MLLLAQPFSAYDGNALDRPLRLALLLLPEAAVCADANLDLEGTPILGTG